MKIAENLYSMTTGSQAKGGVVHCFLVEEPDGLTLIDTGYEKGAEIIYAELAAIGKKATDIKRVLVTHAHASHIGGLAEIVRSSRAFVYAHAAEIAIIEGREKAKHVKLLPRKPHNFYVAALQTGLNLGVGGHDPVHVYGNLTDGAHIRSLQVIHIPGHTEGSLGFWHPASRALFTADTIATWPEVKGKRAYDGWDAFTLDQKANDRSLGKLSEFQSARVLCVGHGYPLTDGVPDALKALRK